MAVKRITNKKHNRKITRKVRDGRKGLVKTQRGGDKLTFLERIKLAVRKNTNNIKHAKAQLYSAKKSVPSDFSFSSNPHQRATAIKAVKTAKNKLTKARLAAIRKTSKV